MQIVLKSIFWKKKNVINASYAEFVQRTVTVYPFMPSGIFYLNSLDRSNSNRWGSG